VLSSLVITNDQVMADNEEVVVFDTNLESISAAKVESEIKPLLL
jgi:hypothetical protein